MNNYIFSVVKHSRRNPKEQDSCEWNNLNLTEAIALYGAVDALDVALNLRDESAHCITLVQRVDGMDMLCSDYYQYDRWKCDPIVHIGIVPLLVEALCLRFEYWLTDIQPIVYDRFFYLVGGGKIEDCAVAAYMNLDDVRLQNMEIEPLARLLVRNMSRELKHDLRGICVLQHLGGDFAFHVFGDQIVPCDAIESMNKTMKEKIL